MTIKLGGCRPPTIASKIRGDRKPCLGRITDFSRAGGMADRSGLFFGFFGVLACLERNFATRCESTDGCTFRIASFGKVPDSRFWLAISDPHRGLSGSLKTPKNKARSAHRLVGACNAERATGSSGESPESQCSFCVMIENFVADLRVESHPFARAHLPKPLLIEVIGETPKAKY